MLKLVEKEPLDWIVACWVTPFRVTATPSPAGTFEPELMDPENVAAAVP